MLDLIRIVDWRTRMESNLISVRTKPFEWGTHDCALFASDHVNAITDVNLGENFRGKYSTALGAIKTLRDAGYGNLLELCQDKLPEIHSSLTRIGDIVILESEETGYGIGIVLGENVGVLTSNGYGIIKRSDNRIKTGFRIG